MGKVIQAMRSGASTNVAKSTSRASSGQLEPSSPIKAICARMEQLGLTRKDLEPMIGSHGRVSEVMTGKRTLTIAMIRRLREGLGISADILIQPN